MGALGQLFTSHGQRLSTQQTASLLRMLVRVLAHCQAADTDRCLRSLVRSLPTLTCRLPSAFAPPIGPQPQPAPCYTPKSLSAKA